MRHTLHIDRQRISAHSCVGSYFRTLTLRQLAQRVSCICVAHFEEAKPKAERAVRQRVVFGAIWKEQRIAYCVLTGRGWCLEQFGGSDALRIAYCVLRGGAHCKRSLEGVAHCVYAIAPTAVCAEAHFGLRSALRIAYCVLRSAVWAA